MKSTKLEEYRDKETGLIDFDKFEKENGKNLETFDEDRGTSRRDKKWLLFEDTKVLVRNENLDEEGVLYTTYQELLFEELAKQVNFPCAHYDIGKRGNKKCVFSYNILDSEENKGLSMMSLSDLLDQLEKTEDYSHSYNVRDAFKAIANYCKCEEIDEETQEEVMREYGKMLVLDSFLSSTDRHCENISFIYGKDEKTGEKIFKLAPVYDNELSCGSEERIETMQACIDDFREAQLVAQMQSTCATRPETEKEKIEREEAAIYRELNSNYDDDHPNKKKHNDINLLIYLMERDEEIEDFANDCIDCINMPQALTSVEERIGAKLPQEYRDFIVTNYMNRKPLMNKALNEFYKIV